MLKMILLDVNMKGKKNFKIDFKTEKNFRFGNIVKSTHTG